MSSSALLPRVLACVVLAAAASLASSSFDPNRVHFIDSFVANGRRNFLFRGNLPLDGNHSFVYSRLNQTLHTVAKKEADLSLPSTYYLTDLSLLDLELTDEHAIVEFFQHNPSVGRYVHWPIVGSLIKPDSLPKELRKEQALAVPHLSLDKLPHKMAMLREMLTNVSDVSQVIYIHCEAGMDRTGEVSGSYYMKWQNMSFTKALAKDNAVETRNISIYSQNGMQWYCYYLFYSGIQAWQECGL